MIAYLVKSPKIFTSEKPINDAGLQSRTIAVKMDKNTKKLPLFKLPDYYEKAQSLRNKLLLWRLRNLNNINLQDMLYGFPELQPFDRRVQQVITPIYYFSDTDTRKAIVKFAGKQQEETLRERRESLEGTIFEAIYDIYEKGENPTLSMIAEKINPANTKYPVTEKKIGNVVRKILGFDIKRLGDANISTVILDKREKLIGELCLHFGILIPEVSVGSVVSVVRPNQAELDYIKKADEEEIPF